MPSEVISALPVAGHPTLETAFTARGGHVGFLAGRPWRPIFWAESRAAAYLAQHLGGSHVEPEV